MDARPKNNVLLTLLTAAIFSLSGVSVAMAEKADKASDEDDNWSDLEALDKGYLARRL